MRNTFSTIPPVVKNLLIINALFLLATYLLKQFSNFDLNDLFALHYFKSEYFKPFQFLTHMFMHANFMHLFFNMYALFLFGQILEKMWGGKRFLFFYLITGFGAAFLHTAVSWWELSSLMSDATQFIDNATPETFEIFTSKHSELFNMDAVAGVTDNWTSETASFAITSVQEVVKSIIDIPTVGASGAVFGILLAFGMLFPNTQLFLMFIPIPIKAKYFVIGYGLIELIYGVSNIPGDNVAHFAHLGGMLFGFILIKIWKINKTNFY
jgi:membrane associated rhomboid family serine protease